MESEASSVYPDLMTQNLSHLDEFNFQKKEFDMIWTEIYNSRLTLFSNLKKIALKVLLLIKYKYSQLWHKAQIILTLILLTAGCNS